MPLNTDFDNSIGNITIIPQDIGRVLLNLYNNAFYACDMRNKSEANEHNEIEATDRNKTEATERNSSEATERSRSATVLVTTKKKAIKF